MKNDDAASDGWEYKYVDDIQVGDETRYGKVIRRMSGSLTTTLYVDGPSRSITKHPLSSLEIKKIEMELK